MLGGFETNVQRGMLIVYFADVLALTAVEGLDRPALASILAPLRHRFRGNARSGCRKSRG